jgi:hypothetical protein
MISWYRPASAGAADALNDESFFAEKDAHDWTS